ncbi:MAG: NADH-quinone oxidoreductase subunit J [Bryobacterales bacterium]|jgi:NADH-quinone oxidoreductase subunit J|nr:NADH-quinone oxidoreductase subunit J [Bryobacterales bacterium]
MDLILFLAFAAIAVICALSVVLQTHPIASALSLVGVMGALSVLYLLLGAEFIAMVQVIVYAGAVMVLFVFVIMLLNADAESPRSTSAMAKALGLPIFLAFAAVLALAVLRLFPDTPLVRFGEFTGGGPADVGMALFTRYLLPFEVISVLILIAIVGAVVLARKEID